MTNRTARSLSEVAIEPRVRDIDGVSIRFAESERRDAGGFETCMETSKGIAAGHLDLRAGR